ncbi:cytochrome P450 [Xylaria palmicola]|nr:cytochrome P450 [Xylaria palmicola]
MAHSSQILPEALAFVHNIISPLSLLLFSVIAFLLARIRLKRRSSSPLPPGPPGVPIVGNSLQFTGFIWLKLAEWARTYGPVVYMSAFGQHVVALNSLEAAFDILDDKAIVTSGRPSIIMVGLMTKGLWISAMPAASVWNRQRKALHTGLRSLDSFSDWLPQEAALLTANMLRSPNDWRQHFELAVHAGSCAVAYGNGLRRDAMPRRASQMNAYFEHMVAAQTPGAYIVELFPWLNYLPWPLKPWQKEAEKIFNQGNNLLHEMYEEASASPSSRDPCVLKSMADTEDSNPLTPMERVWLAGQVTLAGVTNQGPLSFWLMAMVLYPETQKLAHEELDIVVGRVRPPKWEDYVKMPYLQAMVREVLRWRPTSPLGLLHVATEDIDYKGYRIPKGAIILPNIWAINRSPSIYGADAHEFNPSRFLDHCTNQLLPSLPNTKGEGQVVFGFGRRICPGRPVANRLIAIYIMTMLWALRIEPAEGPDETRAWDPSDCMDAGVFV